MLRNIEVYMKNTINGALQASVPSTISANSLRANMLENDKMFLKQLDNVCQELSKKLADRMMALLIKIDSVYTADEKAFVRSENSAILLADNVSAADRLLHFTRQQCIDTIIMCINSHLCEYDVRKRRQQLLNDQTVLAHFIQAVKSKINYVEGQLKRVADTIKQQEVKKRLTTGKREISFYDIFASKYPIKKKLWITLREFLITARRVLANNHTLIN